MSAGLDFYPKQGQKMHPRLLLETTGGGGVFLFLSRSVCVIGLFFSTCSLMSLYHEDILNFMLIGLMSRSNVSQQSSRCFKLESYKRSA